MYHVDVICVCALKLLGPSPGPHEGVGLPRGTRERRTCYAYLSGLIGSCRIVWRLYDIMTRKYSYRLLSHTCGGVQL